MTLIARDGTVLADSHEDAAAMDNHADRPEIAAAFASGYGRSQRFSATRREELTYAAVRLPWHPDVVLRLSEPVGRIEENARAVLVPVVLVTLVGAIAAGGLLFWYAARFGERVRRLVRFSERVAQGDFTPETGPLQMDELDELLASLNRTAAALERTFSSLTKEKNQGATILSSMGEGVAVFDRKLRLAYLNRAFRDALSLPGASWRQYQGRSAARVLEEKPLLKLVKAAMRGKARERELSIRGREVLARGAPIRAVEMGDEFPDPRPRRPESAERAKRKAEGAVLVLMDVTRLHALERVRRDFVANLSHELKTPLTAIRGFSETLLEGSVDAVEQARFLRIIRDHAKRLARLADDLLRLARIESGTLDVDAVLSSVSDVILPVVESARMKAGSRRLSVASGGEIPQVVTDPNLLTEILQNLVDNALQYSAADGSVRIDVAGNAEEVRIAVSDDGVGIPPEHQDRIFERFYRVDPARSRAVGGTGLGLAIAKHAAELLGGRLGVESRPGEGSTFTLALPADAGA